MADHRNGNDQQMNGKTLASAGPAYSIQLDHFTKRLKALYSHWSEQKSNLWDLANALVIATPPPSEDLRYLKSSTLNVWLLGYEFPETIMVFMKKQIHFLCSQKKVSLLEVIKQSAKEAVGADIVMHVRAKSDDGTASMEAIFSAIRAIFKADGNRRIVVGHVVREAPEGKLLENWAEKLRVAGFELTDVTEGLSDLFAVKDSNELLNVKKAAHLTSNVMKNFVVPTMENAIDEEKK